MTTRILTLCFVICATITNSYAAVHYVRPDGGNYGNENGSDWANAYDGFPANLTRGDTYYLGDGTYGAYSFNDSESGSTSIYVKKATASDHGTDTGWNSSYGDGQAHFIGEVEVERGYYELNGNHVPSSGLATEWGFKVSDSSLTRGIYLHSNTIEYVKIINWQFDMSVSTGRDKCIKGQCSGTDNKNITVSYCKFENFGDAISIDGCGPNTFEYNYFHRTLVDENGDHGDAIVVGTCRVCDNENDGNIYRYNHFNWQGQQIFFNGGASDTFVHRNTEVYGNVFYCDLTPGASTSGIHQASVRSTIDNIKIYNNTFYHLFYNVHERGNGMTGDMRNNISYDVRTDGDLGNLTHDYNYYETGTSVSETHIQTGGDPTVYGSNYSDFTLSRPTNAASTLGAAYQTDLLGKTRAADGTWDMGAYEYTGGFDTASPNPPNPPRNLHIVVSEN